MGVERISADKKSGGVGFTSNTLRTPVLLGIKRISADKKSVGVSYTSNTLGTPFGDQKDKR